MLARFVAGVEPVRLGQWCCPLHGQIGLVVPTCPVGNDFGGLCGERLLQQVITPTGRIILREPPPPTCRAGHDLTGDDAARTLTRRCACHPDRPALRGWECAACGDVQLWPPHHIP